MDYYSSQINKLIQELSELPGSLTVEYQEKYLQVL